MGITLHYRAEVSGRASRDAALGTAAETARAHGWEVDTVDAPEAGTRGIVVRPHLDCEPFHLVFGPKGVAHDTCKTAFAPAGIHRALVAWMRGLSPPVRWRVDDSSGYWASGDPEVLDAARAAFADAVARARREDPDLLIGYRLPDGRIADAVQPGPVGAPRFDGVTLTVEGVAVDMPGWAQVTNPSGPLTLSRVDLGAIVQVAHADAAGDPRAIAATARRVGAPPGPLETVAFGAFGGVTFRHVDRLRSLHAWLVEDPRSAMLITLITAAGADTDAHAVLSSEVLPTLRRVGT